MAAHYTYFQHLTADPSWQKLILTGVIAGGLLMIGSRIHTRLSAPGGLVSAVIPAEKITSFGFFDLFCETFGRYHDSVLGIENRKHLAFNSSVFLFVLVLNLIGLIPGFPSPTTSVWFNVAIALVVFCYFNYLGIKEHGWGGYLKHFAGPVWWLAWFIFPLEIFSTALRIFTLNLRLYWNISADHLVLGIFTDLTHFFIPIIFYGLGTFVCFMQAFIFTTLTMIYILLATQHEEESHH